MALAERYLIKRAYDQELEEIVNSCPPGFHLHSISPMAKTQHGTAYFIVVFEQYRPAGRFS